MDDDQLNAAIDLLRANGFVVDRPEYGPWITARALWEQTGRRLSYNGFHRRLWNFPGDYPKHCGLTGRLVKLRPTPELEKWLFKSKQQETKML